MSHNAPARARTRYRRYRGALALAAFTAKMNATAGRLGMTGHVPGSHVVNWIDGPPRRDIPWPDPEGAIEVTAGPGDAVFFDRLIWHTRSRNYSQHTRKAVLFGYTYRWTAIRDELASVRASDWPGRLKERGFLDPGNAPLKP
jgi:ectoine hydroxylase-related dioxygenase (phytanoyl-CoA dioxygenase family)